MLRNKTYSSGLMTVDWVGSPSIVGVSSEEPMCFLPNFDSNWRFHRANRVCLSPAVIPRLWKFCVIGNSMLCSSIWFSEAWSDVVWIYNGVKFDSGETKSSALTVGWPSEGKMNWGVNCGFSMAMESRCRMFSWDSLFSYLVLSTTLCMSLLRLCLLLCMSCFSSSLLYALPSIYITRHHRLFFLMIYFTTTLIYTAPLFTG